MDTQTTLSAKKRYFSHPKDFFMLLIGILSFLYMLNISFGLVEFLPDNLPFLGNIDEALVTTVLLAVLNYFNINLSSFFKRK